MTTRRRTATAIAVAVTSSPLLAAVWLIVAGLVVVVSGSPAIAVPVAAVVTCGFGFALGRAASFLAEESGAAQVTFTLATVMVLLAVWGGIAGDTGHVVLLTMGAALAAAWPVALRFYGRATRLHYFEL